MIKKIKGFCILLASSNMIYFSTAIVLPQTLAEKMQERLKQETNQILVLKNQKEELQHQLLIQKKIDAVMKYYKNANTLKRWYWIDRDYVEECFKYCEKWKYLAGDDKRNMVDFMIAVLHNESNFDSNCKTLEWDKTYSYGITQINEKCLNDINKELNTINPEFKNVDLKTDVEKNIAGRYLWIKHRKAKGQSWAMLNDKTGWVLFWWLSQVKL